MGKNGLNNSSIETLNQRLKKLVSNAQNLEELEKGAHAILDSLKHKEKIAFVAGRISAKTKLGKIWNRYKLYLRTNRIAKIIAKDNIVAISSSVTPYHLEKYPVKDFYAMYDRITDRSEILYLTVNWRMSKGAVGEYKRSKKRGIDIYEVRESSPLRFFGKEIWVPVWFKKMSFVKIRY